MATHGHSQGEKIDQAKLLPAEHVAQNGTGLCMELALGLLDVCIRLIQEEHKSFYFHSVLCSFQSLAF